MTTLTADAESHVLEALLGAPSVTIEELTARLSDFTWSEVLHAVDVLSRRGDIVLRRRGFQYDVSRKHTA